MTDLSTDEFDDYDYCQFLNTVGDIADRICSMPNCLVVPEDVTLVSCILAGDFPTETLFRPGYDGIPNEKDETLLRDALKALEDVLPEHFQKSEAGSVNQPHQPSERALQDGHFIYVDSQDGVIIISHKETRIPRLLSDEERAVITDFYIHNMVDEVCACCRERSVH